MSEILKMAIRSLYNNKLRSFLSSLGIIIGVTTIVLVIAIGLGAQKSIQDQYANLAVTSILVNPVSSGNNKTKLSQDDIIAIKENVTEVEKVTPILQGKILTKSDDFASSATVLGISEGFLDISKLEIELGSFFSPDNLVTKSKYAILGNGSALDFFQTEKEALGKTIVIGKKKLEVIGVFKKSGTALGPITYDDSIFLPYEMGEYIMGDNGSIRLVALAKDIESINLAITNLGDVLRKEHKLKDNDIDDFRIVDQGSKVTAAKESSKTMTLLLTGVAIIVLVVSGIGIMNVMFAGIAERTKEIGILKSIGIKTNDILQMFLYESIIISIGGGIIGILISEIVIPIILYFDIIDIIPSFIGRVLAFIFAVFVGIFFGYYPAYKASKLDPVDALRS